jgi:hypothetical protein
MRLDLRFSQKVQFPGKPTEKTQKVGGVPQNFYQVEERNGAYTVNYADMPFPANEPPGKIKERLDEAVAGMGGPTGGKVVSQSEITLNGKYPAREFKLTITQPRTGLIRGKICLKGRRLYQVFVVGDESFANSANATKFIDSFTLID